MKHGTLAIRNWREYQHYKDRNPPWVKLHVKILRDQEFRGLSVPAKALTFLLLAVGAETDNKIPANPSWLSIETALPVATVKKALAELLAISFVIHTPFASKSASKNASESAMPRDRDRDREQSSKSSNGYLVDERALSKLLKALKDKDEKTETSLRRRCGQFKSSEGDLMWALECATGPGVQSPTRVAMAELKKRGEARK